MIAKTMTPEIRKLMQKQLRIRGRRSGQGMTEYIIIVGLIAILMVAAVMNFKSALNNAFQKGATKIQKDITEKMQ